MLCSKCGYEIKEETNFCPMCGTPAGAAKAVQLAPAVDALQAKYPLALPPNTILAGQYLIEKVLGQGGFGITYLAFDHKNKKKVAIKEYFPEGLVTRMGRTSVTPFSGERGDNFLYGKDSFLQEAETLAQFIGNKGIVCVYSYFEEYGTAYYVMEYVEGISFGSYIKQHGGRLSVEEAKNLLLPVMDSLAVVHSKGVIHRDVAPDNILISNDGTVKLLDFGAARYSLGDRSRSLDVILKHGYAPKEQYTRRSKQGPFTDVYALGATFYYAVTGKCPPDSIERMDKDELIPPSALGVKIRQHDEEVLLTALRINAADRFQNMIEFINALYPSRILSVRKSNPEITSTEIFPTNIPVRTSGGDDNKNKEKKYKTSIVRKVENPARNEQKSPVVQQRNTNNEKQCRYALDDLRRKVMNAKKHDRLMIFKKKESVNDKVFVMWKNDVDVFLKDFIAKNDDIAMEVFLILPCKATYGVIKSLNKSVGLQIEQKYNDLT
ncbi:MAG: protein kinase [Lachnospiraceae bacterium]|nr:protein kinase [Lachnospiraceae bacterium]